MSPETNVESIMKIDDIATNYIDWSKRAGKVFILRNNMKYIKKLYAVDLELYKSARNISIFLSSIHSIMTRKFL